MDFNDANSEPLKNWMIKKLSKISDADPDVLADYVLALVKSDEPEAQARANCQESLEDFLEGNTKGFIDDVFAAVKTKSYLPAHQRPKPAVPAKPAPADGQGRASSTTNNKRSFDQAQGASVDQNRIQRGNKMARGARGGRGRGAMGNMNGRQVASQQTGMPTFDANDAASMMAAMQAMMGIQMPGLGSNPNAQPCKDFFERGVCYAGMSCPYDHGSQVFSPPNGFGTPSLPDFSMPTPQQQPRSKPTVRRGKNGRPLRAPFSQVGPSSNKRNPSVVVEQIPQEHASEEAVRDFFSAFGEIESITMQPESQLAIVTYKEWESAKAAYESPKAVFDNRFVKIYWHRPPAGQAKADTASSNGHKEEPGAFDKEEFEKSQAEAQKKHEEYMKKVEAARVARQELDAKVAAHSKALRELKKKVAAEAAPTQGDDDAAKSTDKSTNPQTAALEAQLRALEEEAETLGLPLQDEDAQDSTPWSSPSQAYQPQYWPPRGRGRGRGRVFAPRGSYRGRGRAGGWTGGSVARLDNRPRNVDVVSADEGIDLGDEEHSEALRTTLFAIGDFVAITRHPDHPDQKTRVVICFHERYVAESFISVVQGDGNQIAGVGKCKLGWVTNDKMKDVSSADNVIAKPNHAAESGNKDEMDNGEESQEEEQQKEQKLQDTGPDSGQMDMRDETDHDVADDDDDRWMK